ncbi:MAG: hypothetical protein FKGGLIKP_00196 [Sodalis sp. Fse]|nr:MAG: hypothetical protein FKGGLIKP_00196 [Sodalis sp. Fse]
MENTAHRMTLLYKLNHQMIRLDKLQLTSFNLIVIIEKKSHGLLHLFNKTSMSQLAAAVESTIRLNMEPMMDNIIKNVITGTQHTIGDKSVSPHNLIEFNMD